MRGNEPLGLLDALGVRLRVPERLDVDLVRLVDLTRSAVTDEDGLVRFKRQPRDTSRDRPFERIGWGPYLSTPLDDDILSSRTMKISLQVRIRPQLESRAANLALRDLGEVDLDLGQSEDV